MSSEELRNCATVVAATVALLVFIVNVWSQMRNRRIENLGRFNEVHERLFANNGYLAGNLKAIEDGTMQRDVKDPQMESRRYLDGIASDSERYKSLTPTQRAQFWR